ncbi:MAG: hypothetical protein R2734_01245 [Nocardioides sp.]
MHAADSHDLIRRAGRSGQQPQGRQRRAARSVGSLFTGVSGSGRGFSLVFDTIAAESQRLINETYSAFVQGFMPTLARPEVDRLEGSPAIIVDRSGWAPTPAPPSGTATDAYAIAGILFSRIRTRTSDRRRRSRSTCPPGSPAARSCDGRPRRGKRRTVRKQVYQGGMCPLRRDGAPSSFDLTAIYDAERSLADGALLVPGYSMDGWYGRIFRGAGFDMDKPVGKYPRAAQAAARAAGEDQRRGRQPDLRGRPGQGQKSMLSKDVEAMQPHGTSLRRAGRHLPDLPRLRGNSADPEQARSSRIQGRSIAELSALQVSDLAAWLRGVTDPGVAPLVAGLQHLLDSFTDIGLGYLSLDRPARTLSGGEAQRQDDPTPRLGAHRRHLRLRQANDRAAPPRHNG